MRNDTLVDAIRAINRARHEAAPAQPDATREWEARIEAQFAPSQRLAVYGSLMREKSNAAVLENVPGRWETGQVHGELHNGGWGSAGGYPGLIWDPNGPPVEVELLISPRLPGQWARLDEFEGEDYCRILVPVFGPAGLTAVANLYALREGPQA